MKKAFTLIEVLIVMAIIAILLVAGGGFLVGCNKSTGSRVGIVSKISNKGLAIKSWEGQLMLGNGQAATTWEFSVVDDAVAKEVQEVMRSGKRVELHYNQSMSHFKTETPYIVDKVDVLEK